MIISIHVFEIVLESNFTDCAVTVSSTWFWDFDIACIDLVFLRVLSELLQHMLFVSVLCSEFIRKTKTRGETFPVKTIHGHSKNLFS